MNSNHITLITGASSGIGRVFARRFAQSGYDLIITGRRKDKLLLLAEQLKCQYNTSVKVIIAELSAERDVRKLVKVIESHHNIDVLVNNAGYGSGKEFCKCNLGSHLQMLQVHVITTLRLIHAVLPQMISRGMGTIINVSSLAAFMPAPGSSIYSATKMFLKCFTESLHMEVRGCGIKLQCLCPGFTFTDFHERRMDGQLPKNKGLVPWMDAETVVDRCLRALAQGKIIYVPGYINRMLVRLVSVMPNNIYYNLMMKAASKKLKTEPVSSIKSGQVQPAL